MILRDPLQKSFRNYLSQTTTRGGRGGGKEIGEHWGRLRLSLITKKETKKQLPEEIKNSLARNREDRGRLLVQISRKKQDCDKMVSTLLPWREKTMASCD